jgi:hypothetical protein
MVGINRARDVSFTARKIDAETAHCWGLVSQLFESKGELLEAALRTAKMISRNDAKLVENYKKVLITGYGMSYQDARYDRPPACSFLFLSDSSLNLNPHSPELNSSFADCFLFWLV